ncbi:hypothetical protein [Planomonospora sp. ID82291]|uniref:hypothetical protein n=1 Tax=Planomonospora sp. ID82291 TaxID=2738136 RepID=UPI0018C43BE8|nr:hypothetical protein [Planomonospora sp. ID82291]MBG0818781.1 hypothetical protein [Planomonospora sp. ID82291]
MVLLIPLFIWIVPDRPTTTRYNSPHADVTVVAPEAAGTPRISPAKIDVTHLPAAVRALSEPVHIESDPFDDTATITFRYDPAKLPAGALPQEDLAVFTYVEDWGLWLPVGDEVDTAARTVSATTGHFSTWMLAVTDPQELMDAQAYEARIKAASEGFLAEVIFGEADDSLTCDPKHPLVAVRVRAELVLDAKLCQELLDNGQYRLQYVNTSGLPQAISLPDGFTQQEVDYGVNAQVAEGLGRLWRNRPVIGPGKSLTVTFTADALAPGVALKGDVDWGAYLVSTLRVLVDALLLGKADTEEAQKTADKIDKAFLAPKVWDCLTEGAETLQDSKKIGDAVRKVLQECVTEVAKALLEGASGLLSAAKGVLKTAGRVLKKFLDRRLKAFLDLKSLMDLVRAEVTGIPVMLATLTRQVDTTITIEPSRLMTPAEAAALPASGCTPLPQDAFRPPGMPLADDLCVHATDADLDGNGKKDRLLTWRPILTDSQFPFRQVDTRLAGAAAYLDDGSTRQLVTSVRTWVEPETRLVDSFDPVGIVHLDGGTRSQVRIRVLVGSSTLHEVVLSLGRDRQLRLVGYAGEKRPLVIMHGSAHAYSTSFGCVVSGTMPLLVMQDTSVYDGVSYGESYAWYRYFYRFDGAVVTAAGSEGGFVKASERRKYITAPGAQCRARGPQIGQLPPAAATPEDGVRKLLAAALKNDQKTARRYIATKHRDDVSPPYLSYDVWNGIRAIVTTTPKAWANPKATCQERDDDWQFCTVTTSNGGSFGLWFHGGTEWAAGVIQTFENLVD